MAGKHRIVTPPPGTQVFSCPQCAAQLSVIASGHTLVVACGSCGAIVDAQNETHQLLSRGKKLEAIPRIPLGSRGKLHGYLWAVIGFMVRYDKDSNFEWSEYLLFNPKQGYRWLIEADGHWNYTMPMRSKGQINSYDRNVAHAFNRNYQLFHKGTAVVKLVIGEFYWQVRRGDTVSVRDYIQPPEIVSIEESESEENWSLSEYIDGNLVKSAFNVTGEWPTPSGFAPNQPNPIKSSLGKYWAIAGIVLALLFVVQIATMSITRNKTVWRLSEEYQPNAPLPPTVSEPFVLKGWPKVFTVKLLTSVQNSWFSIETTLFNTGTGQSFAFEPGVEYYSGSGWSEGSRMSEFRISSLPAGTYTLAVSPKADPNGQPVRYDVEAKWGGAIWSNYLLASFAVFLIPLFVSIRSSMMENRRWSQSDYTPSGLRQDEEE